MRVVRILTACFSVVLHALLLAPAGIAMDGEEESVTGAAARGGGVAEERATKRAEDQALARAENKAPMHVTLYVEPVLPAPPPGAATPMAEPPPGPVEAKSAGLLPPPAEPPPEPEAEPAATLLAAEVNPDALPEPIPEPIPEPLLSDADRAALAAIERGGDAGAPLADDDGAAHEARSPAPAGPLRGARARAREARARAERLARTPCPESPLSIARSGEQGWFIDRELIEYYATHIAELQKLGSVWTHRGPDGEPDGFRVGLARCSVLRQGGLQSGDVVRDINGRRIHSVFQAVGAYLALRRETTLQVHITRRGAPMELTYQIEPPTRGGRKAREPLARGR